ncbi:MAG: glycosyltransferase family 2 protein [Planctomycetota bacterium]|nr:glycosyltransferase family 2 protein [Planctomycetota bacterium]MDW8373101.1 glycosyltransferase family 2 protein [Planctomycetota bacterium]
MRVALIISTYQWPAALRAVLHSVRAQTRRPDEVLIADDGSGEETAATLQEFRDLPLAHVWHPDEGFRLAEIRNKAIAAARSSYLISIDGDMLLHPRCVADHLACARPGSFVQGSRIPLSEERSAALLADPGALPAWWQSGVRRRWKQWRSLTLARCLAWPSRDPLSVRGCHQAFWREDLLAVNGFDGEMQGWGREDNELAARLIHAGVVRRNLRQAAIAWHLWHPERSRAQLSANDGILQRTLTTRATRCVHGIDRWLADPARWIRADWRPSAR